jgi:hypothetical protein
MHFRGLAGTIPRPRIPEAFPGGASCESRKNTSKPIAFEVSSKRRKGFPSETHVKHGDRVVAVVKILSRNSAAMIRARADLAADFKRCCMLGGEFDGSDRHYYSR